MFLVFILIQGYIRRVLPRYFDTKIQQLLKPGKVLVLYGPRQVGKTTLIENFLSHTKYRYRLDTGEDIRFRQVLSSESLQQIKEYAAGYELVVIDEAQKIPNVGTGLKLLVDHCKDLRVIATGSASFDLSNRIGEPLTGRKTTKLLFPISQLELATRWNSYELKSQLSDYLIFGSYPEVLTTTTKSEKIEYLHELAGAYLLKDVLELESVKNPKALLNLLKLLAFQIGRDVSLSELGAGLGIDYKTVARYLDLLEMTFVIKRISGFSRNLRKEVSKNDRYYFIDNGIRNTVISNFNNLELRNDVGQLWENFIMLERIKRNTYLNDFRNIYYWRTYDKKEIDLIEEKDASLYAYEFKFSKKRTKQPIEFLQTYENSTFASIHQENYVNFVTR